MENAELEAVPNAAIIAEAGRLAAAIASLDAAPAAGKPTPELRRSPRKRSAEAPAEGDPGAAAAEAVEPMIQCWRPGCGRMFQRGQGSAIDETACGLCPHFGDQPDGQGGGGGEAAAPQ